MPSLEAAMRRREFISLIGGALAAAPAQAQPGKKIPTVAYLWHAGSAKEESPYYEASKASPSWAISMAATFGCCITFRTKCRNVSGAWLPSLYR
jgi:hypothetical protein